MPAGSTGDENADENLLIKETFKKPFNIIDNFIATDVKISELTTLLVTNSGYRRSFYISI